jgi:CheY-like chemotaxis protein
MGKTILLIDDDSDDTEIFCEALRDVRGDMVCVAMSTGPKALEFLNDVAIADLAAIFLDINMPVMSGWDVLEKLKTMRAIHDVPVIMYSNTSNQNDVERAQKLGAASFFVKSFNYHSLTIGLSRIMLHLEKGALQDIDPHADFIVQNRG